MPASRGKLEVRGGGGGQILETGGGGGGGGQSKGLGGHCSPSLHVTKCTAMDYANISVRSVEM